MKLYLASMKSTSFKSKIDYLEKLKLHYISVTDEVLKKFKLPDDKSIYNQRFEITINDKVKWKGGTVALGNNSAYITFSKQRMKEADVHFGDNVDVHLVKDTSEFGFDVPFEFSEVLNQDPEGKRRFDLLKKGFQRAIIYLVVQIKSSDKRIEKSIFLIENLKKSPEGNETMRHVLGKDLPA